MTILDNFLLRNTDIRRYADKAFDAQDRGVPHLIDRRFARHLVTEHGLEFDDFERETQAVRIETLGGSTVGDFIFIHDQFDAADVLGWLGY